MDKLIEKLVRRTKTWKKTYEISKYYTTLAKNHKDEIIELTKELNSKNEEVKIEKVGIPASDFKETNVQENVKSTTTLIVEIPNENLEAFVNMLLSKNIEYRKGE